VKLRRAAATCFLSFGLVGSLGGCIDEGGPTLDSLSASVGQAGSTIELSGTRLCGALDDCSAATGSVTFDDATAHAAPILGVTPTTLRVVVPPMSPGIKRVVAIVDGESSNALDFEVVP
jgi:hypothetical protein